MTLERYWQLDYSRKLDRAGGGAARAHPRLRSRGDPPRLIADVPLGAFLSGGIDSSAVVAAMAQLSPSRSGPSRSASTTRTSTSCPTRARIAEQFGTEHEEFQVRADAIEVVPRIVRHYGEPFADSSAIPCFYLAELTRRHVTVALNGDGGDESFAGYQRYVANAVAGRLDGLPAPLRRGIAALGAQLPDRGRVSSPLNRARRLSASLPLDPAARYERYVSWFDGAQRRALYTPEFAASLRRGRRERGLRCALGGGVRRYDRRPDARARRLDVSGGDLIAKVDIATMAHALEARSPLLDHQLMELAASIPAELKVRGGEKKWIFREALRGWLPGDLLDRPKQGFSVPLSSWLRGDLQGWAREMLLDPATLGRGYFEPTAVRRLLDGHAAGRRRER